MAKAPANPKIGTITCNVCKGEAEVAQMSGGKGRYLYTRGCECKYLNSHGKSFQSWIWNSATWDEGATPICPPNVDSEAKDFDPTQKPEPKAKPATVDESGKVVDESVVPAESKSGSGFIWAAFGVVVTVGLLIITGGRSGGTK